MTFLIAVGLILGGMAGALLIAFAVAGLAYWLGIPRRKREGR